MWEKGMVEPAMVRGDRLRTHRERCGLTQRILGEIVGVTDVYISKLENDRHTNATVRVAIRICDALGGLSLDYLCGRSDQELLNS
jgi:transcriptional regulator with XRE-family HTH domain